MLATLIGIVAGAGAIVFSTLLDLATRFFLGTLAGATLLSPAGEGNIQVAYHVARPWAIPLVVGLGGLLSGVLVFGLAPEAEGHGTDAAIEAVHHNPSGIRARVSAVKIIASALTIGSGGSGGREGPTAQISAGFGSLLSRALDLTPADARIAVTVGIASGIGAIFRAPLGGAVLGAEILYREDAQIEALIPGAMASIVAYAVFGAVKGFTPIFGFLRGYHFSHPAQLLFFLVIGIGGGLLGRLYSASFYKTNRVARRFPGPRMLKPAVAGALVGVLGLVLPGSLGTGYGWVQRAMGPALLSIPLWVVLALPFAKIVATSLSIGSGGSGGVFGPGMVVGGFMGAGMWRLLEPLAPGIVPHNPAPFVVVGMIACFGSIAHAPLAVMLMVAEMTGSLELLAPAMIAIAMATLLVGDRTIYRAQLKDRSESTAARVSAGLPLLGSIRVVDALVAPPMTLAPNERTEDARRRMQEAHVSAAPVVDGTGRFRGVLRLDSATEGALEVSATMNRGASRIPSDATLEAAAEVLADERGSWVTVLDDEGDLAGIVGIPQMVAAYRSSLESGLRTLDKSFKGTVLLEAKVDDSSPACGRQVFDAPLPQGSAIVSINRAGHLILPGPATLLAPEDGLTVLVPEGYEERLRLLLSGEDDVEPDAGLI